MSVAAPAFNDGTATDDAEEAASPAVADPEYFSISRKDGTFRILGVDLPPGSTIATCPIPELKDHIAAWMPISPATAREWDERYNKVNRSKKKASQAAWADDVRRGRWIVDGNTIIFTPWGEKIEQLDGQHRLGAIADGNRTVWSLVVIGIDPAARWVIDSGNSRSVADVLKMNQYANPTILQALSKRYPLWLEGTRVDFSRQKVSPSWQLTEFYRHEQRLVEAAAFGHRMSNLTRKEKGTSPPLSPTLWGLAHLVFNDAVGPEDKDTATYFLERQFFWGDDVGRGDPATAARNRLMTADKTNENLGESQKMFIVVRGWNGWRGGIKIDKIQLPASADGRKKREIDPEDFPEVY